MVLPTIYYLLPAPTDRLVRNISVQRIKIRNVIKKQIAFYLLPFTSHSRLICFLGVITSYPTILLPFFRRIATIPGKGG